MVRWLQHPDLESRAAPSIPLSRKRQHDIPNNNSKQSRLCSPIASNKAISSGTVFAETQAALKTIINGVQTTEQLHDILQDLEAIRYLLSFVTSCVAFA
jgi:hypothetical protein